MFDVSDDFAVDAYNPPCQHALHRGAALAVQGDEQKLHERCTLFYRELHLHRLVTGSETACRSDTHLEDHQSMKTTDHAKIYLLLGCLAVLLLSTCRSADRTARLCEQSNTECHENCDAAMQSYSQNLAPSQTINQCDVRCEQYFNSCLSSTGRGRPSNGKP